jgi:hypothetical protein
MELRQLVPVACVLGAGLFLLTSAFAIRKGVVAVSWRSPASVSLQRSVTPIGFWLVVCLHIGIGIALLCLAWYAV